MPDNQTVTVTPTASHPEIFPSPASLFSVGMDASQISITFYQSMLAGSPQAGQVQARTIPTLSVVLPAILAKDLHKVLGQVLRNYEAYTKSPIPDVPTEPFTG